MEQELFKDIYNSIHLDKEQKGRLWQNIEDDADEFASGSYVHTNLGKRISFSARAAVCVCVLLVSGITVLAANEISLTDKLAGAVNVSASCVQRAAFRDWSIKAYGRIEKKTN